MPRAKPFTKTHLALRSQNLSTIDLSKMDQGFVENPIECAEIALDELEVGSGKTGQLVDMLKLVGRRAIGLSKSKCGAPVGSLKQHAPKLADLLFKIKQVHQVAQPIRLDSSQPFIEDFLQPYPGEMVATLGPMAAHAKELLTKYERCHPDVFSRIQVALGNDEHDLGSVILALHAALETGLKENKQESSSGNLKTNARAVSIVAADLVVFAEVIAPSASDLQKKEFVHICLNLAGVPHPSPDDHGDSFNKFYNLAAGAYAFLARQSDNN